MSQSTPIFLVIVLFVGQLFVGSCSNDSSKKGAIISGTDTNTDTDLDTGTDSESGTGNDTTTDTNTGADTGTGSDTDTGGETDTDSASDTGSDTNTDDETDTETGTGSGTDTTVGTDSDTTQTCESGLMCGTPAQCCDVGEECLQGNCLLACPSGIRCSNTLELCCDAGEVCVDQGCEAPGQNCGDSYDCPPGEFCEPTLDQCLTQPESVECEIVPLFDELTVKPEWSYEEESIISTPVVADIDRDGIPEVIVNFDHQDGGSWPNGAIGVIDGVKGTLDFAIPHDPSSDKYGSHGRSSIAVGDVDGDSFPDIVYAARAVGNRSLIIAVDHLGELIWTSRLPNGDPAGFAISNDAITLANFDEDPASEVVIGAVLIDNDGLVVWDESNNGTGNTYGTNDDYMGGISAVADLDGDKHPEIISGKNAFSVSWTEPLLPGDPPDVLVTEFWTYDGNDGYPAIADLDGDGMPDVVLVASSQVVVLNGQTGKLLCGIDPTDAACLADSSLRTQPVNLPGSAASNRGGPPTISDFDSDGRPEIGVAGGYAYAVFDLNRTGEQIEQPDSESVPENGALFIRWYKETQDLSSNATGSSVFDFQGDGAAEVVYGDECYIRVYSGVDGEVQLEIPNTSATIHEYPIIVDVDADGNSEILVVSNTRSGCPLGDNPIGLFCYGDANDEWVPTRKVWTQHAYHVTNAMSDGNVPFLETDNWSAPGLNNYRQNVQGDGVFNAADLTIGASVKLGNCAFGGQMQLVARVANEGALGIHPGVKVAFYKGTDASGELLGEEFTSVALLPGASTEVSLDVDRTLEKTDFFVVVDDGETGGEVEECDETNNTAGISDIFCPPIS